MYMQKKKKWLMCAWTRAHNWYEAKSRTRRKFGQRIPKGPKRETFKLGAWTETPMEHFAGLNRHLLDSAKGSGGLQGPASPEKMIFLTLAPRLGPEGTWLSLQIWKRYEDKGARRGSDTKGT